MSDGFCTILQRTLFPSKLCLNQQHIDRIDIALSGLYEAQNEKNAKLNELKASLRLLEDHSNSIDPRGLSRGQMVATTKARANAVFKHSKLITENIGFFEQCKTNLEHSAMNSAMTVQIGQLRNQLQSMGAVDTEKLRFDVDDIAEINDQMKEVTHAVHDTMHNAWEDDMEMDEALEEFLKSDGEDLHVAVQVYQEKEAEKTLPQEKTAAFVFNKTNNARVLVHEF